MCMQHEKMMFSLCLFFEKYVYIMILFTVYVETVAGGRYIYGL
jgi:hypothetical protein